MIIGFDGKRAVSNATGLGNYSRLLIDQLSEHFPQHQYYIYSPKPDDQSRLARLLERECVSLHLPQGSLLHRKMWRSVIGLSKQAQRDGVDILHGLSAQLPLVPPAPSVKQVVTVHDLIYCHFPHFYNPVDTAIYRFKCLQACKNADRVVAVSLCTKRDIINFLGIPEDKISVIYQGCDSLFSQPVGQEAIDEVKKCYALPARFLLNVGTIEERKNILLVVKALEHINDKDIPLVIVGRRTKYADMIDEYAQEHGLTGRIIYLHQVHTRHLPAIYHLATCFVYPSRYEGFGIPIIEAQSCGAPVIVATGSCLEEAAGTEAPAVNPDSVDEMVEALNSVLGDESLRHSLIEHGRENVKRFELDKLAGQMMALYQEIKNLK